MVGERDTITSDDYELQVRGVNNAALAMAMYRQKPKLLTVNMFKVSCHLVSSRVNSLVVLLSRAGHLELLY